MLVSRNPASRISPNASKTQPLARALAMRGERLTRREIVGHPQPRLATGADQQGGPMKQFEAERLHALQQGHDGVLPGAAPRRGARLELEVRQQVVGEQKWTRKSGQRLKWNLLVYQAAVPTPVAPKYTTSGVRRPRAL